MVYYPGPLSVAARHLPSSVPVQFRNWFDVSVLAVDPDPSWFYSSLAQSSAAVVGFVGAFLIFRIQDYMASWARMTSEIEFHTLSGTLPTRAVRPEQVVPLALRATLSEASEAEGDGAFRGVRYPYAGNGRVDRPVVTPGTSAGDRIGELNNPLVDVAHHLGALGDRCQAGPVPLRSHRDHRVSVGQLLVEDVDVGDQIPGVSR